MPLVRQQFNQNGSPLAGGKLFVYAAGTTTKATTYTDSTGNTPNTNPIILDANGQCSCWLDPTLFYKFILSPSTDTDPPTNPYWTVDNVAAPAPIAVGNMTDEKGSDGNFGFKAGTDFTAGTTTSLTLSKNYGSASNLWVAFDAAEQGADTFSINGTTLTFNSPIPIGTTKVYVKGGTSLTVGTPGSGTVTDASVAAGSKLYNRINETVSVIDYGADPTGVSDSTNAFTTAVSTGRDVYIPKGTYLIKNQISVSTQGQRLYGDGKYLSTINVTSAFNMVATGVFVSAAVGVEYVDFSIAFSQPDTAVKASLIAYPPAISGLGMPGQRVRGMIISAAWNGLDWRDNVGQSLVEDLTMSAFNIGIQIDGSTDSVRFRAVHFWPANLTANQTTVMTQSGGAVGWSVGRCDDLHVTDCLTYCWSPFVFFSGTRTNAGSCFGTITDCDMDAFGGITMSAGSISVVGGFQSSGLLAATKLNISGGNISYTGVQFQVGVNYPAALFSAWMTITGTGLVSMTGCQIDKPNDACLFILGGGTLQFNANSVIYQQNAGFLQPIISAPAGTVEAIGNQLSPLGTTGTQPFFIASVDGPHVVTGNQLYGNVISAPIGQGFYGRNIQAVINQDFTSNMLVGSIRTARFTVTADASGNVVIAHNIAGLQFTVVRASAFYRGGSGQAVQFSNLSVDGTNISGGTAAAANARVRVTIDYTTTQDLW